MSLSWRWIASIYCFLGFIFCLYAFFPGWMTPDSNNQFVDAQSMVYRDWHPVLMAWLWSYLNKVYPGPAGFLILNTALYWGAVWLFADSNKRFFGWVIGLLTLALFSLPSLLAIVGVIWKDVFFAVSVAFAFGLILNFIAKKKHASFVVCVVVFCLAVLAVGSKPNGTPAVFVLALVLFSFLDGIRKALLAAIVFVLSIILSVVLITQNLNVKKCYPIQYIQTYDLLGISVLENDNLLPPYILEKLNQVDRPLNSYYFEGGNNVLFYGAFGSIATSDSLLIDDLAARWIEAIGEHPIAYLKHRWGNFSELLRLGSTRPAYVANIGVVDGEYTGILFRPNVGSDLIQRLIVDGSFFLPWIYIVVSVVSLAILVFTRWQPLVSWSVFAMGWTFLLPHYFIAPASDYRYLYFFYMSSLLLMSFALGSLAIRKHRKGTFSSC